MSDPPLIQYTAIHCATYFSNESAVRALLDAGHDPNSSGGVHDRPLHIAASKPQLGIVTLLLEAGADPSLADDEGNTALHFAAKTGHSSVVNMLLGKCSNHKEVGKVVGATATWLPPINFAF